MRNNKKLTNFQTKYTWILITPKNDKYLKAFEELFRTYFTPLCYFAQKYINDTDSCKELVHSVFIRIWENRDEFDFEKPAKSYLFTAVNNRCKNYFRDKKKFDDSEHSLESAVNIQSDSISDEMEIAELDAKIKQSVDSLPEKTREIFQLNRFEGKKYAEIAELKKISVKTVEAQMSKALKILREELKDYIYVFLLLALEFLIKK